MRLKNPRIMIPRYQALAAKRMELLLIELGKDEGGEVGEMSTVYL